jgi:hypothetical protein
MQHHTITELNTWWQDSTIWCYISPFSRKCPPFSPFGNMCARSTERRAYKCLQFSWKLKPLIFLKIKTWESKLWRDCTITSHASKLPHRQVPRWWVDWHRHFSFGCPLRPCITKRAGWTIANPPETSDGPSAVVLTSSFAPSRPYRSYENFAEAWRWPVINSSQIHLTMLGSAKSIRMAKDESTRVSCSKWTSNL